MQFARVLVAAVQEVLVPSEELMRMRFRQRVDTLITALLTGMVVVLAVGYQVFGRWVRRSGRPD
jgi:hypothetical protein